MNLKHLSYFVDISKRESFTKAADDIYVSQSALSKSVKSLEQELNVTLIDRTSKSFNLTEEGKILFLRERSYFSISMRARMRSLRKYARADAV